MSKKQLEGLREEIAIEISESHIAVWEKEHDDVKNHYRHYADRILATPEIARALDTLADLEAGRLVRLAKDQSYPENPYCFEDANFEHMAYAEGQSEMIEQGFRRVELEVEKGEQSEAAHD